MNNLLYFNNEQTQSSKTEEAEDMIIDKYFIKKESIVQILQTPFEDRTEEFNTIIQSYILDISDITKKFSLDNIDERDYKEMIGNSLETTHYKLIKNKSEMIYDINGEAQFFYIIIKGYVKIFNMQKLSKEVNGHSYYKMLLEYRNKCENYLLKKTIDDNFHNFPVEINDMKILDKIMVKLNLMKLESDEDPNIDPDYLEFLLRYYGSSLSEFGLETYNEYINKKNEEIIEFNKAQKEQKNEDKCQPLLEYNLYDARIHSNECRKKIIDILSYISPELCRKYYFFLNENYENITYYIIIEDKERKTNNYFGDLENNRYKQRAITNSENVELLVFSNGLYKDFIRREKAKILDAQVSFFINNFFFEKISKEHFIRFYFSLFETVSYTLNQVILSENEKVEYIYFIKSGEVKLISNRSILENYIMIDLLKNITKKPEQSNKSKEKENNLNKVKEYMFKSDVQLLKKELNIKHKSHLITYQANQALGYESFYYGTNYLYTAIAETKEVTIYRLKIKHLIEILNDKNQISYKYLIKKAKNRMKLLLERFIMINNDLMKFYDKKLITKKTNIEIKSAKKNKESKDIRKLKNIQENFGINLSEQNTNKYENTNINNLTTNDNNLTERKNYIKKLIQKRISKNETNKNEESRLKSPEFFRSNTKRLTYNDFFEQKALYPKIETKLKKYNNSPENSYNYITEHTKSLNFNTNYSSNNKKEIKIKNEIKKVRSQKQLFLSKNYFFSDKSTNTSNIFNRNNILDNTLLQNKKLLSNIFCSISSYKKISNDEIKKKLNTKHINKFSTLKNFNKLIRKQFLFEKNDISYKYDFKRDLDNNLKLLRYSVFDKIKTPKYNEVDSPRDLYIIKKDPKRFNINNN